MQASAPAPVVCDLAELAYQSPAFVERYFGQRQHADYTGRFDPTHRLTRNFEYPGSKASPGVLVSFYHNRAVEVVVFFFEQQTPEETARRVGLRLTDFKTVRRDDWKWELAGTSRGVTFESLMLTNISNRAKNGTWNIIAKFAEPNATKHIAVKTPPVKSQ